MGPGGSMNSLRQFSDPLLPSSRPLPSPLPSVCSARPCMVGLARLRDGPLSWGRPSNFGHARPSEAVPGSERDHVQLWESSGRQQVTFSQFLTI